MLDLWMCCFVDVWLYSTCVKYSIESQPQPASRSLDLEWWTLYSEHGTMLRDIRTALCSYVAAPLSTSSFTTCLWRLCEAARSALPYFPPCALTSAPLSSSSFTTSLCPFSAANNSGAILWTFVACILAPSSSDFRAVASWPCWAA